VNVAYIPLTALSAEHRDILAQNDIVEAGVTLLDVSMDFDGTNDGGDIWVDIEANAGELDVKEAFMSAIQHISS
jgi:hypothetical protein